MSDHGHSHNGGEHDHGHDRTHPQSQAQAHAQAQQNQVDPIIVNIANFLRDNATLRARQGFVQGSSIDFYRVKRAVRALLSDEYKKKASNPANKLPPIADANRAKQVIAQLVNSRLSLPAKKLHTAEARSKGLVPKKGAPCLVLKQTTALDDNEYLVWFYTKRSTLDLVKGALVVLGAFTLILFPLWPIFMRRGVWYLSMGALGFIGLFFVLAIVRLIIFCLTVVFVKPGLWIFPNLFEDCGFFDSFRPLYGWNEPKVRKGKKKNDSGKVGVEGSTEATSNSSQVHTESSQVKKRVQLEEIEE